jgi:oligopeptide/dipeptide ABC transporter ATP-binding protein
VAALLEVSQLSVLLPHDGHMAAVVDTVDFQIQRGEFVGLVGESGSGKSMTARALIRLLPKGAVMDGSVRFDDREVTALSGRELRALRSSRVAMIFQDPRAHIDPLWRVADHVAEALRFRGIRSRKEILRRSMELLESVGIIDPARCLRAYPSQLSGGMLQRAMIAGALAAEPEILIADEPTTALDVTTQAEIMAILADLKRERELAMLFITHDLELASAICDRVLVMYAGTIVEDGPCATFLEQQLHPYTWGLLRARPTLNGPVRDLAMIPGQSVSGLEAPPGCPFSPRCNWREARCEEYRPPLVMVPGSHRSACRRIEEIADDLH